jgi:hypothetical protein
MGMLHNISTRRMTYFNYRKDFNKREMNCYLSPDLIYDLNEDSTLKFARIVDFEPEKGIVIMSVSSKFSLPIFTITFISLKYKKEYYTF